MTAPSTVDHEDLEHRWNRLLQVYYALKADLFSPRLDDARSALSQCITDACMCHLEALWAMTQACIEGGHPWTEGSLALDCYRVGKALELFGSWRKP